jgi:MOSC domain-containing protein YiiM
MGGRLEAIWMKRMRLGPMDAVDVATLDARGLVGNANRGGRRQVTIISLERWRELEQVLSATIDPSVRRANLLVSGVDLERSRDRVLRVGATRLRVNGETRPCEQMESAHRGLQEAMRVRWGGGAFAEVLDPGIIRVGDQVEWELPLLDATDDR